MIVKRNPENSIGDYKGLYSSMSEAVSFRE